MISIIVCSVDERRFSAVAATYGAALEDVEHEIIRIPNAHSMCEGYNRGIAQSRGDTLIFSHDDIEILSNDFPQRLTSHFEQADVIGVAGTTRLAGPAWGTFGPPHVYGQLLQWSEQANAGLVAIFAAPSRHVANMQALDGVFLAARRPVVQKIPFDDQTFTSFHLYDLDFSYRAHLAGFRVGVACDLGILHHSEGTFSGNAWQKSADAFIRKYKSHFQTIPQATWQRSAVRVSSRAEGVARMHPPHWSD